MALHIYYTTKNLRRVIKRRIKNTFKTKKQLREEISRLEKENKSINQERLSLLKNRTINYEMLNMLKAIVLKTGLKEIEISQY